VRVSPASYEGVWDVTVRGPNEADELLHVEVGLLSESRIVSDRVTENLVGLGGSGCPAGPSPL
jgi:hypothetical protein